VRTGLTLFDAMGKHNFPTLLFYETGYDLFTLRQASRRSWRIGQKHACRLYYLYYGETMQARAMGLMAQKLDASLALEGQFSAEGLAAMSADSGSLTMELAKSLVQTIDFGDVERVWAKSGREEAAAAAVKEVQGVVEGPARLITASRPLVHNAKRQLCLFDGWSLGARGDRIHPAEFYGRRGHGMTAEDRDRGCGCQEKLGHLAANSPLQRQSFPSLGGMTVHFLARGGVPHRRRQAVIGQPDLRRPKFVRHAEDTTVHQGGVTIAGHPSVSVPSLLETSYSTAFQCFEFRDGNLGLMWPDKGGAATNRRQIVGKRTVVETISLHS